MSRPDWFLQAACRGIEDPDIFFPEVSQNNDIVWREARGYCGRCPVVIECAQYAIDNQMYFGMWGSLSPRQRQRKKRNDRKSGAV